MIRTMFGSPACAGVLSAVFITTFAGTAFGQPANWSAARIWDEQMLSAIRIDTPRPPVHARNLYHVSAAMWDAWAAYDAHADQIFHHERATATDVEAARRETISYAAYRLLKWRYQNSANAATTMQALDNQFTAMGFSPGNTDIAGNTPAALGNRIYNTIRSLAMSDGANESGNYGPTNGYAPVNDPLIFQFPGTTMNDPNRWQPLAFSYLVLQNGIIVGAATQSFVCPHWASVAPFAIHRPDSTNPYFDPGPPPRLGSPTDAQFKAEHTQVVQFSSYMNPFDGVTVDISPGADHNNPLGTNSGTGYPVNPVTGQPYAPNIVRRGDYARVLAEFWADGPHSETPPGHWNVIANKVGDDPSTVKRIGGTGPIVGNLEWDVKTYLAVNGAVHDAAVCAWGNKGKYDSVRPLSAIRYMGTHGQCSDANLASYDQSGFVLIPGLVELITPESSAPGQRHQDLADYVGEIAVYAWRGQPQNPQTQIGGTGWIRAKTWMPYQASTFVTPPFAGFISGHSTFSRSAAEVLTGVTGTPFFPGGLGTYNFPANAFLSFEQGPSQPLQLQWATYYDAADEAGISRLYGGIHIQSDDLTGRILGSRVGKTAWTKATKYFNGQVSCPADFDGNHVLGIPDVFAFINTWFSQTGYGSPADFDEDGALTVQDIFAFLTAWFAGCNP